MIAMLVHPMMVAMDLIGPLTILNLIPGALVEGCRRFDRDAQFGRD